MTERRAALLAAGAVEAGDAFAHFGDPAGELAAGRGVAVHADLLGWDTLRLTGADTAAFLGRLCTLDVKGLPTGATAPTFWLDARGRVEASAWLVRTGDDDFLALAAPGQGAPLSALLDRYHFGEAFEIQTPSDHHWRTLAGPGLPALLDRLGWPAPAPGEVHHVPWGLLARTDRLGTPTVDAWLNDAAWATVRGLLTDAGAVETGALTLERLRVLHGAAAHPAEYGPHGSPLEIGMAGITDGKGCYPGQEVIERTLALGKPPRALRRVRLTGPAAAGDALTADGKPAGLLTTAVSLPDGEWVGLALIKRRLADGTEPLHTGDVLAFIDAPKEPR